MIEKLEKELQKQDKIIVELSDEVTRLKKERDELKSKLHWSDGGRDADSAYGFTSRFYRNL